MKAFGSIQGGNPCPELHIPHKEWSGREELENYVAIERWAKTRGCAECSCYVKHMEVTSGQTIAATEVDSGYRADPVEIVWETTNECGTLTDENAMLVLHVNWRMASAPGEPTIDNSPAYPNIPTAVGVFVYAGLDTPSTAYPIAGDTKLALGGQWAFVGGDVDDQGSISVPINIFPAGQDFTVWAAQNSSSDKSFYGRADLYTVCACSCVL